MQRERYLSAVLCLITIAYVLVCMPTLSILYPNRYGIDSSVWMVIGQGVLDGKVPYRDLFDHKGPFVYFIYALSQSFSSGKMGLFILAVPYYCFIVLLFNKVAGIWMPPILSFVCTCSFFIFHVVTSVGDGMQTEDLSLPFILIPMYWFLKVKDVQDLSKSFYIVSGLCLGLIAMIRVNNAVVLIAEYIVIIFVFARNLHWRRLLMPHLYMLIGLFVSLSPFVCYFVVNHALYDMIWGCFLYNIQYLNASHVSDFLKYDEYFILKMLSPCIISILMLLVIKRFKLMRNEWFLIVSSFLSIIVFKGGSGYPHYYNATIPAFLVSLFVIISCLNVCWKRIIAFALVGGVFLPMSALYCVGYFWGGKYSVSNIMIDDTFERQSVFSDQMPMRALGTLANYRMKVINKNFFISPTPQVTSEVYAEECKISVSMKPSFIFTSKDKLFHTCYGENYEVYSEEEDFVVLKLRKSEIAKY